MKRHYSRVDLVMSCIVWIPMIIGWVLCIPILFGGISIAMVILSVTLGASTILIASIYTNTYYTIDSQYLHWRTGPFNGKIDIKNIISIGKYDSMMGISSMIKPSLGRNPLKVQYGKYDDMPFSPKDEHSFIKDLRKVNSEIETSVFDQLVG